MSALLVAVAVARRRAVGAALVEGFEGGGEFGEGEFAAAVAQPAPVLAGEHDRILTVAPDVDTRQRSCRNASSTRMSRCRQNILWLYT